LSTDGTLLFTGAGTSTKALESSVVGGKIVVEADASTGTPTSLVTLNDGIVIGRYDAATDNADVNVTLAPGSKYTLSIVDADGTSTDNNKSSGSVAISNGATLVGDTAFYWPTTLGGALLVDTAGIELGIGANSGTGRNGTAAEPAQLWLQSGATLTINSGTTLNLGTVPGDRVIGTDSTNQIVNNAPTADDGGVTESNTTAAAVHNFRYADGTVVDWGESYPGGDTYTWQNNAWYGLVPSDPNATPAL
jgi:hypothetical protein